MAAAIMQGVQKATAPALSARRAITVAPLTHAAPAAASSRGRCRGAVIRAVADKTTYEKLAGEGMRRTQQYSKGKKFVQALIAGCFIGFGGTLCSTVGAAATDLSPGVQRFLFGAIGFPLSIFLCTITDASASTANLALYTYSLVERRELSSLSLPERLGRTFWRWLISWAGNACGLLFIAWLVSTAGMEAVPGAYYVAEHKLEADILQTFLRGVGGGWLITLAVVCGTAANTVTGKFVGIWLCISTYVMCGWEHGLANIFFFPCALFAGIADSFTWADFIYRSLIPATIGNIVGGTILSAGLFSAIQGNWLFRDESQVSQKFDAPPSTMLTAGVTAVVTALLVTVMTGLNAVAPNPYYVPKTTNYATVGH